MLKKNISPKQFDSIYIDSQNKTIVIYAIKIFFFCICYEDQNTDDRFV